MAHPHPVMFHQSSDESSSDDNDSEEEEEEEVPPAKRVFYEESSPNIAMCAVSWPSSCSLETSRRHWLPPYSIEREEDSEIRQQTEVDARKTVVRTLFEPDQESLVTHAMSSHLRKPFRSSSTMVSWRASVWCIIYTNILGRTVHILFIFTRKC